MDTEIPSVEYIHLHHWKELGYDFAPLIEMLTYLPDRPKKAWRSIAADHEKLGRFFKAVRFCKSANGIAEYFKERMGPVAKGRPKGEPLEPGNVRSECRDIADQADALRNALFGVHPKLLYRFGRDIDITDVLRCWAFTLVDISELFSGLGYDGKPDHFYGNKKPKVIATPGIDEKTFALMDKIERKQGKKVIPMDGMPALNAYHDLARELLNLTDGVKSHARAIWAMVALHFEDGRTANDLKNKSQDYIAEWLEQRGAREFRALPKRQL
jgi:hypothetical protein